MELVITNVLQDSIQIIPIKYAIDVIKLAKDVMTEHNLTAFYVILVIFATWKNNV